MTHENDAPVRGPMPRWMRILGWIMGLGLTAALCLAGGLAMTVLHTARSLPGYDAMKTTPQGRTVRIIAADGTVLQTMGPAYGEWLPAEKIPDIMKRAMIAIEDRRFESHPGVDAKALARVVWLAWKHRDDNRRLQGASTITQQAARTVFLSRRYDLSRKLREMVIALAMEQKLGKQQILELYLNRVYLGGGAYGIDAASRRFFGHPATEMTLSEAALIAGLARAPSDLSPSADPKAAFERQKVVLSVMKETGVATDAEIAEALANRPEFAKEPIARNDGTSYFIDYVRPQIEVLAADRPTGAIDVHTTLDPKLQALATASLEKNIGGKTQGAIVTLDTDGAVRALVGGKDYAASPYNRATQAMRQPGSAFKLFVYLAALEKGMRPGSAVVDAPITIEGWSPRNANGGNVGTTTMSYAFAQSINTVAARLGKSVGTPAIASMAHRFGVTGDINTDPAMVLGSSETRLIDMTRAYASIASGGVAVTPYGIDRIVSGKSIIYKRKSESRLLVTPQVARDMSAMLRNNVTNGTGREAQIGRPVGGKTGTTSASKDGWFLGFSSGLTTGVWVGRDDAKPIDGLQGGRAPARIFAAFMRKAVEGRPVDEAIPLDDGGAPSSNDEVDERNTQKAAPADEEEMDEEEDPIAPPPARRADADRPAPSTRETGRSRAVPMDDY